MLRKGLHSATAAGSAALAASLAFGLARNQPFVDGNTRTAHVAYREFLALNDAELDASGEDEYIQMLSLAEATQSEAGFADWLRPRLWLKDGRRVQEATPR